MDEHTTLVYLDCIVLKSSMQVSRLYKCYRKQRRTLNSHDSGVDIEAVPHAWTFLIKVPFATSLETEHRHYNVRAWVQPDRRTAHALLCCNRANRPSRERMCSCDPAATASKCFPSHATTVTACRLMLLLWSGDPSLPLLSLLKLPV